MTQTHRQALPKGYMLGEYQVDRVLGAGGFGLTYLGWDTGLNKPVAIKEYLPNDLAVRESDHSVLPKSDGDKENFQWGLDRFLDEARTLASFKHPNIIGVYRYFTAHNTAYIVMEFAEGETLSALLERRKVLDESTLLAILNPLLDGLAEVHRADFLHRDIKPGNILIRADGSPVLLDFGAARQAVGSRSRSITSVVTPGYAPIEQYSSRGNQGPWTDIYALGAVLYKAVCGEAPVDATERMRDDPLTPASQACSGKYSAALLDAIDWALAVDEEERPQSIAEWRKALSGEAAQKQAPAPAPKPAPAPVVKPPQAPGKKPAGRARMVGLALALAVAAGGATVGYDYYQQRQSEIRQAQQAAEQESATAREEAEAERRAAEAAAKKAAEEKAARQEAERLAREKAEAERRAAEVATKKKAAEEQAARQEAERLAREKAQAERRATEAAAKKAAEEEAAKKAAEEALAQKVAQEEAAAQEAAARKAKAEAEAAEAAARKAKAEAEAAEAALRKAEAERQAAAAKKAAEEASKREAERLAREKAERERPGRVFQDCPDCPQMVVVPAGSFMMGSSASERGRDDNEGPAHRVRISNPFAVGVYEVTRGEYARFVSATGYSSGFVCWKSDGGDRSGENWQRPGFSQNDDHPVVCVNWDDAQHYVRWLSAKTGQDYRLLSEAEWEYVARAGTTTPYHTGRTISTRQAYYNSLSRQGTMEVGSFPANQFGLHDVLGNIWELTQDCWNDNYNGAPTNGSAWESGDCVWRMLRGGSWVSERKSLRSANRYGIIGEIRLHKAGFRIARTLTP